MWSNSAVAMNTFPAAWKRKGSIRTYPGCMTSNWTFASGEPLNMLQSPINRCRKIAARAARADVGDLTVLVDGHPALGRGRLLLARGVAAAAGARRCSCP